MTRGTLTILEAETGSGKTEAALAHYFSLCNQGSVSGLYFALPSRTSAVQIHSRVSSIMKKAYENPPPVLLAVPGYMRVGNADGKLVDGEGVIWDDDVSNNGGWLAENSKRYLAAPIAVGTVDQLYMGVLKAKHGSMRWASAARSLLVVDEVHASDPYMFTFMKAVVVRHLRRGGHLLLMSATLGSEMACACLSAASEGVVDVQAVDEAIALHYPLIRKVSSDGSITTIPVPSTAQPKQVEWRLEPIMEKSREVADLAASHVTAGAKVLVIRNTVSECISTHNVLETLLERDQIMRIGKDGANVPHHGRYCPEDRRVIDEAIEATFGKGTKRRSVVAVTTQTAEQSLDIDADILITDLCPMDVLLQRIGRLHRHSGRISIDRPKGYEAPRAIVLCPLNGVDQFLEKPGHGIGKNRAYRDVAAVELTRRMIAKEKSILIPAQNRYLVESCVHPEALSALENESQQFALHAREVRGIKYGEMAVAASITRNANWVPGDPIEPAPTAKEIQTRLGEADIHLRFTRPVRTQIGSIMTYVKIPYWQSPRTHGTSPIVDAEANSEGVISFRFGSGTYLYSRFGLEKVSDAV